MKKTAKHPHVAVFVDTWGHFGQRLLMGIAEYVETHRPWSLFFEMHGTNQFDLARLIRWKGDGVLAFIKDREVAARVARLDIPTVETDGHVLDGKLPLVGNDEEAAGRLAAEHLLERGFSHFAYSGYPGQPWAKRRRRGFTEALLAAGYACRVRHYPRSFTTPSTWENAQRELTAWLAQQPKPLAIMACSDRHAQNVLDARRRAEIAVPDDLAVIGTDNEEAICRLSDPPLSSVANNPRAIGYKAAKMLDQLMSGQMDPTETEPVLVPPQGIVTRRSTDVMITEDKLVADALRFIRRHACDGIDVNAVLRQVPLSRNAFYRRFRKVVGRSLHGELLRVRLNHVKNLLRQTSLPLKAIAHLAGFEYAEYMGAVFKQRTGITPTQYRTRHRWQQ